MEFKPLRKIYFGNCRMCLTLLSEEEYHLGSGRCIFCARKCEEEAGFGTIYGNIELKKAKFVDNSKW